MKRTTLLAATALSMALAGNPETARCQTRQTTPFSAAVGIQGTALPITPNTVTTTKEWPGLAKPWVGPTNSGYPETRVKLHPHRGMMMVDVIVGGVPVRMLLDTGANMTVITEGVAATIIANGQGYMKGKVRAIMASGRTEEFQTMYVKELQIGPHTVRDLTVSVSSGAKMLLPFPVVGGIGPFTIDTQTSELIWRKRG